MRVQNKSYKLVRLFAPFYFAFFIFAGCKKAISVDPPPTALYQDYVFASNATAASILTDIYTRISLGSFSTLQGVTSISLYAGLSADEIKLHNLSNTTLLAYYRNSLSASANGGQAWNNIYPIIYSCNAAIEGLNNSTSLTPSVKNHLLGEAKFMRAFFYFYLVNLYGDVPLVLGTHFKINAVLARSPKTQVYQQIITDLIDAQNLLSSSYLNADALTTTTDRVRPTKWAATALLARTYLYNGNLTSDVSNYANAEAQATAIINNSSQFSLTNLNNTFLKNSTEAIWQLQPVIANQNTQDARYFTLPSTGPNTGAFPVYLNPILVNEFEIGDQRKASWTGNVTVNVAGVPTTYFYAAKYKVFANTTSITENLMVLRLAEQYLIRAEARARQGNLAGAIADLDKIRQRASLPLIATTNPGISKTELLTTILHERQVEFFTEWGHRWLDLKRTNTVDAVMSVVTPIKGGTWSTNWQWYPVPLRELQQDPNLTQNNGY